jgi:hypothetical protein
LAYLDYEGPLSGQRGSVSRVDAGEFRWIERTEQQIVASLAGGELQGTLTAQSVGGESWRLSFESAAGAR